MTLSTSAVAVCCCKRFAQLVEQARVLDGDDGLGGEVLDQLDLLVGERPHLLAINGDGADQLVLLEHRARSEESAAPATLAESAHLGFLSVISAMWEICFVSAT